MPGITTKAVDSAGGVQLAGQNSTWTFNGQPLVLKGDPVQGHGKSPHDAPVMIEGSAWMTLNGIPVVHAGHAASCGHTTTGQADMDIE